MMDVDSCGKESSLQVEVPKYETLLDVSLAEEVLRWLAALRLICLISTRVPIGIRRIEE
jgi:hypothetical protein